ncbi:MAG: response regulator [Gammaproteobacteria bacterium]|nr:response regulator [Gammaproteobacteria bacterium]MBT7479759.1 response regulator [Gammaproteobacteria bacterium]HIJ24016.1 response regulator [Gammaproteobacteria bacterium]HIJ48506.1 response regulator [Gammaproteobacteria bacterium]
MRFNILLPRQQYNHINRIANDLQYSLEHDPLIPVQVSQPVEALAVQMKQLYQYKNAPYTERLQFLSEVIRLSNEINNYLNQKNDFSLSTLGKSFSYHIVTVMKISSVLKKNSNTERVDLMQPYREISERLSAFSKVIHNEIQAPLQSHTNHRDEYQRLLKYIDSLSSTVSKSEKISHSLLSDKTLTHSDVQQLETQFVQEFQLSQGRYAELLRAFLHHQEEEKEEMLNQNRKDRYYFFLFSLVALLITISGLIFLSRQFSRPLNDTIRFASQIQHGNYSEVVNNQRFEEFSNLFSSLNEMASTLRLKIENLSQSEQRAHKASEAKDEFLASMSHELRTPLTSIIGNSEYLSEKLVIPDLKEVVRGIETAGRSQLALVNDILDMSKIESGKFTIDDALYNFSELLNSVEKMVSIRAQDAGLTLSIEQQNRESHKLIGDSQRISQILINLLSNSIKFTERGKITLITWVEDQQLHFQVKDTGIGMSKEEQQRLFKRFEQADSSISRRFGGIGLGLYISMNLAQLMGGTMRATSQQGEGSTFTLSLPYRRSDVLAKERDRSARHLAGKNGQFTGHVLIAEDTPELLLLEQRILENMGITVITVMDGAEAVKAAQTGSFNLILMDMQMPVMDGIEATKRITESGNLTPIVALTANVMAKHRDQFEAAGCSGFLAKPIDKDELIAVLGDYLSTADVTIDDMIQIIEWDERYSVGNQLLDEQHQQIVGGINQLVTYCYGKKTQASHTRALRLLSKIEQVVSTHIKDEEALLRSVKYPELEAHIESHRHYMDQLSRLFQQDRNVHSIVEITRLMIVWWKHHILMDDMEFKSYLIQNEEVVFPIGHQIRGQSKVDEEVDDELISIFKESASKYLQQLKQGVGVEDWEQVREVSYTLKGTAASFGFPHISKLASDLQNLIDEQQIESVPEMATALIRELEQI